MTNLKPAQRKRLEFVESELFWHGMLTKGRIAKEFDVDPRTVQTDLATYRDYVRGDADLDEEANRWVAKPGFRPRLMVPDAEDFLHRLARERGLSAPATQQPDFAPDDMPVYAPPELPRRRIDPECLRWIVRAVRRNVPGRKSRGEGVELLVVYRSPNRPNEEKFWIGPHALEHDSFRWAVRAFRSDHDRFGDVVLDRVLDVIDERVCGQPFADEDEEWNRIVEIRLAPNPELPQEARRHIEAQYGMRGGALTVPVRQAFIVYFLKRYQIEEKSSRKAPYQEPLVVENRDEITALIPARMRVPPDPVEE